MKFSNTKYVMSGKGFFTPLKCAPFNYSDGDLAENTILKIINTVKDKSANSDELLRYCTNWTTQYHLSPCRANLFRPLQSILLSKDVLELGAGCGALTRYFSENCKSVVAVEGSARRSEIIAARCENLQNVTVINDKIQNLNLDEKFDIVTLIGVLEYSRIFDSLSASPELKLVQIAKSFLKPNGILILAIENKIGLKYFAGAIEDHAGQPFFGIHNNYTKTSFVTFGRVEIEDILRKAGFKELHQFIPLPDYKLPSTIIHPRCSEIALDIFDPTNLTINSIAYDYHQPSCHCFSLEESYKSIIQNNLLKDLCNSFLYIASSNTSHVFDRNIVASHYATQRLRKYSTETLFIFDDENIKIQKNKIRPDNHEDSKRLTLSLNNDKFHNYKTMYTELCSIVNTPNWTIEMIAKWSLPWIKILEKIPHIIVGSERCINSKYIDLIPTNCLINNDNVFPFDLEWSYTDKQHISIKYVIFRGITESLSRVSTVSKPEKNTPLNIIELSAKTMHLLKFPITGKDVVFFINKELEFQKNASGQAFNIDYKISAKLKTRTIA
jgi:SAM-dependent methyltransferase